MLYSIPLDIQEIFVWETDIEGVSTSTLEGFNIRENHGYLLNLSS
jgi:hypothetical protein